MSELDRRLRSSNPGSQNYALWLLHDSPEEFDHHSEAVLELAANALMSTEQFSGSYAFSVGLAIKVASLHRSRLDEAQNKRLRTIVNDLLACEDPQLSAAAFYWIGEASKNAGYAWDSLKTYLTKHDRFHPDYLLSYSAAAVRALIKIDERKMLSEGPLEALLEYQSVLDDWLAAGIDVDAIKEERESERTQVAGWIAELSETM